VFRGCPHPARAHVLGNCCLFELRTIWKSELHHHFFRDSLVGSASRHAHITMTPSALPLLEAGWTDESWYKFCVSLYFVGYPAASSSKMIPFIPRSTIAALTQ